MAIMNVASSGKFSSDRTIAEYGREIWYKFYKTFSLLVIDDPDRISKCLSLVNISSMV
jgi:hypothetical protein